MTQIKAELVQHMGSDLTVVNAARVSFDKESEWNPTEDGFRPCYLKPLLGERDQKLISYLARHRHFTPFTHCQITLRETVPIFVARQRFKHTVGFSYNEVSRRYVSDTPEFYMPNEWRKAADNVKQGSSDDILNFMDSRIATYYAKRIMEHSLSVYEDMLARGVAPEQARMVLPQSMMTSYYVTGSLEAFARAYNLRADKHSQKEIQDLAAQWNAVIEPLFPVSWRAITNG